MMNLDEKWRQRVAPRCGGPTFDAPGGGYAFSSVLAEERELEKLNVPGDPLSALLRLSIADPTWKMPEEAMRAALNFYHASDDATRYTDNNGIAGTHETIAAFLNQRYPGLALTPDWVQYSPGAIKRALAEYIPTTFMQQYTQLIFPTPGYPVIKSPINTGFSSHFNVSDLIMTPTETGWKIPYQILSVEPISKMMYVNMPHNPTGSAYTKEEWQYLIAWATENNVLLVVDEAYTDLRYNQNTVSVLTVPGWEESCIVLQSVSKGWNATGLRFGWMTGHPTAIKAIRKVTDVKDSGLFGPSIAAALECLAHPEWAEKTRKRYYYLHLLLCEGLREAGFQTTMPAAGLCQFTPAPRAADGYEFLGLVDCAKWFRKHLRISLMHYEVNNRWYLRWAVTIKSVSECELPTEEAVIQEVAKRLGGYKFSF